MSSLAFLDSTFAVYTLLALVPNLLIILWVVARLSHDLRLLKQKNAMMENDINLLDQSISSLTSEFQVIRQIENRKAGSRDKTPASQNAKAP